MLNNKTIFITGGTGSFGKRFVKTIVKKFKKIKKIIIFSRDELKQYEMSLLYPPKKYPNIRFLLGDIRDKDRLNFALNEVDYVIHAAALKQVPAAEYNPFEFINTNIVGGNNLIQACLLKKVKKVIMLSTDKAVTPINLYGATKLCAEKLFLTANNIKGLNEIKFSVVRYGNVVGSRGSVIPHFLNQKKKGALTVTDKLMTRFNMELDDAVEMVLWSLNKSVGGEIFVPKLPSFKIMDLAKAIDEKCKIKIIGIRPGEKISEELISYHESQNCYDLGKYYAILVNPESKLIKHYKKKFKKLSKRFSYTSGNNSKFLKVNELKKIIIKYSKTKN